MGLLDLLREQDELIAKSPAPAPAAVSVVPAPAPPPTAVPEAPKEGGWLTTTPRKGTIELLEAPLMPLPLGRLVWAPWYRCHDKLFPARTCDPMDVRGEKWVQTWPIPRDETVIQLLVQEQTKTTSSHLIVKTHQLVPYWADTKSTSQLSRNRDEPIEPLSRNRDWHPKRLAALQTALEKKYTARLATHIYQRTVTVAEAFLSKAREYEQRLEQLSSTAPPTPTAAPSEEEAREDDAEDEEGEEVVPVPRQHVPRVLQVGDHVTYLHKVSSAVFVCWGVD